MVFLFRKQKYDGRGRTLSRNLYLTLRLGLREYMFGDEGYHSSIVAIQGSQPFKWATTFEMFECCIINTISRSVHKKNNQPEKSTYRKFGSFISSNLSSSAPNPSMFGQDVRQAQQQKNKNKSSTIVRIAKIGAVGIGVGAVLAVTGTNIFLLT